MFTHRKPLSDKGKQRKREHVNVEKGVGKIMQNMTAKPVGISDKKVLLISHLLTSSSVEIACQKAGISRNTYYNWIKDEPFRKELEHQRQAIVNATLDSLKSYFIQAIDILAKLMHSESEAISRLACKDIIECTFKTIELRDMEERLQYLETWVKRGGR